MPMQDLTLMSAMLTKMNWMEERQKVLSQNIANADTPDYRPQDVKAIDFKSFLNNSTSAVSLAGPSSASLATTDVKHILSGGGADTAGSLPAGSQRFTYETSPAGNAVILEEQLIKMNQNYTDYQFTSNLYRKNMQMMKDALK
jgi:flagellar basal-body rod protein FlgB